MADGARERSIWAWGFRDRVPDEAARTGLAQMIRVLLPSSSPSPRALPAAEPAVPATRIAIPDALAAFSSQAPRDRAMRSRGRAYPDLLAGFAGDYAGAPDLVTRP